MIRLASLLVRLVASLLALAALLAFLGRLKLLYYYKVFGVDLGLLQPGLGELLFESWFVAQNLLFVIFFWWVALKSRVAWAYGLAAIHALIPIGAHYAFLAYETPWARFAIDYRHTLLKLSPFACLALVWLLHVERRQELRSLRPPLGPAGMILFALLALAWSISTAKHCGSFDANLVLREPASHLPRVRLAPAPTATISLPEADCFLLRASRDHLVLWEAGTFAPGREEIRTRIVPRSAVERIEARRPFQVQPGNRLF